LDSSKRFKGLLFGGVIEFMEAAFLVVVVLRVFVVEENAATGTEKGDSSENTNIKSIKNAPILARDVAAAAKDLLDRRKFRRTIQPKFIGVILFPSFLSREASFFYRSI